MSDQGTERCEVCREPVVVRCAGLDVPQLPFCAKHGKRHADECEDVRRGRSWLNWIEPAKQALVIALLLSGCSTAPTPVAAPTAAPSVAPVVVAKFDASVACGAPPLDRDTARRATCRHINGGVGDAFTGDVAAAQALIGATRPDLFGRFGIKDEADYVDAVVEALGRAKLCAARDGGDALVVKADQSHSERYDIVAADGTPRLIGNLEESCSPASW